MVTRHVPAHSAFGVADGESALARRDAPKQRGKRRGTRGIDRQNADGPVRHRTGTATATKVRLLGEKIYFGSEAYLPHAGARTRPRRVSHSHPTRGRTVRHRTGTASTTKVRSRFVFATRHALSASCALPCTGRYATRVPMSATRVTGRIPLGEKIYFGSEAYFPCADCLASRREPKAGQTFTKALRSALKPEAGRAALPHPRSRPA